MRHTLHKTGLSLSQAASISNLCYQRALEISHKLHGVNNATKTVTVNGADYDLEVGKPIPSDTTKLIEEKAKLHATQAFLMSNMKAKEKMLKDLKMKRHETKLEYPEKPKYENAEILAHVDEEWGWDQLTTKEYCEYLEHEAYAAHIGQFIHKDAPLDVLRRELPKLRTVEFIEMEKDKKSPVKIKAHHTSEDLLKIHEELAALHRTHEMKVNFYRAKVKNLVTEENARISKENGVKQATVNKTNEKIMADYNAELSEYNGKLLAEKEEFEGSRQDDIKTTAALRIGVDPRFKETIDSFLKDLEAEPEA